MYVENGYVESGYVEGNEVTPTDETTSSGETTPTTVSDYQNKHYSLNGSHGTHKDGLKVQISNSKYIYTIIGSHFYMYDSNKFSVMYVLKNEFNMVSFVPASLIIKYEVEVETVEKKDD